MDDFLIRSLLAGILMMLVAAPMGCLMVWQRLAFLADTLGHASVLGVALGLVMSVHPLFSVLVVIVIIMLIMFQIQRRSRRSPLEQSESVLAIISYTALSAGILLLGFSGLANVSIEAILFGDLLATTVEDLIIMALTVGVLLILLWRYWPAFVAMTLSPEIAQAEAIAVTRMQVLLYLMIALLVAVMMKVMGVLLIGAMLVIPVNTARLFSRAPEQMVGLSLVAGLLSLFSGMTVSWWFDLQTGPSIVVLATFWLLLAIAWQKLFAARE